MPTSPRDQFFDAIQIDAVNRLRWRQRQTSNLYLDRRLLQSGETLGLDVTLDRPTTVVFADDAPGADFGHSCRYLLYDVTGAFYREVQSQFPPYRERPETLRAFHQPVVSPSGTTFRVHPELWCPRLRPQGERYAILFSGFSFIRNLNTQEFCYRMLVDRYGFKPANIHVLRYDGTLNSVDGTLSTWPGDHSAYRLPVSGQGTRAAMQAALADLAARIHPSDLLFIHTENEAGIDPNAFFWAYGGPSHYYGADFAADLATLPRYQSLIVLLAQCFAAGFTSAVMTGSTAVDTTVSAATTPTGSVATTPDGQFVKFGSDWISAQMGHDQYGAPLAFNPDTDGDGVIEAEEAFAYAYSVRNMLDQPSFTESSEAGGDITLAQRFVFWRWWCWLVLPILARYAVPPVGPESHARVNALIPELQALVVPAIDRASRQVRDELTPEAEKLIAAAFQPKPHG